MIFKRAAAGALDPPGFQASDTNSEKLLFVGGAISGGIVFGRPLPFSKDYDGRKADSARRRIGQSRKKSDSSLLQPSEDGSLRPEQRSGFFDVREDSGACC